jgi:hypothetical protein
MSVTRLPESHIDGWNPTRCGSLPVWALWTAVLLSGAVLPVRAADRVQDQIAGLAAATTAERVKKAFLEVAWERATEAEAAGDSGHHAELLQDLGPALAAGAATLAAPAEGVPNLSVLHKPRVTENNPYLDRLMAGAEVVLHREDAPWPMTRPDKVLLGSATSQGEYNPRDTAIRMEAYLWLFANPASPLHHDSRLLARFLRRAHAYTDAIIVHDKTKGGQSVYDDFAIAPASCALREFARLYPGLLLPSQQARWDRAMRLAGDKIMAYSAQHRSFHAKGYANIHMAMAMELLNFGLYLNDAAMLARSREFLESQRANVLPDGGLHYIAKQNESPGYHDVIAQFIAQIHAINGDPLALELLKRLEWYGPVSIGRMGEYWTAPSWKHTWNSGLKGIAGGEYVAAVTGNPYVRGMLVVPEPGEDSLRRWEQACAPLPWFRNDVQPLPLPDRVTYPDRNIDGPRAWYDRFTYAATLRDIPEDEPGHTTLMGAMVTQPNHTLQSILMGAYPRVKTGKQPADPRSWSWLTSGMKSSRVIGRHFSAFSAGYALHAFGSSQKGPVSKWRGRQVWLGLPDRLIGWMAVDPLAPSTEGPALTGDLQALLRLGTGGTINGPKQTVKPIDPSTWAYGDLTVRVIDHNFKSVEPRVVPFRLPDYPVTEITFEAGQSMSAWCLVEIKASWAQGHAQVKNLTSGALAGFQVDLEGKSYWVVGNTSGEKVDFTPAGLSDKAVCHRSGAPAPEPASGGGTAIAGHGTVVWIGNPGEDERQSGWENFQQLLASRPAARSVP